MTPSLTPRSPLEQLGQIRSRCCEELISFLNSSCRAIERAGSVPNPAASFIDPTVAIVAVPPERRDIASWGDSRHPGPAGDETRLNAGEFRPVEGDERPWPEISREIGDSLSKLALTGDPGSGKTLTGHVTVFRRARAAIESLESGDAVPGSVRVPVWIEATLLIQQSMISEREKKFDVAHALIGALETGRHWGGEALSGSFRRWLKGKLLSGRPFVVIDGIENIPEDENGEILTRCLNQLEDSGASIVVTCRTTEWDEQRKLAGWSFPVAKLRPFSITQQESWIEKHRSGRHSQSLIEHFRNAQALRTTCRNPLNLASVADRVASGELKPGTPVSIETIYGGNIDEILRRRWGADKPTERENCQRFLAHMAWRILARGADSGCNRFDSPLWMEAFDYASQQQGPFLDPESLRRLLLEAGLIAGAGADLKGRRTWGFVHRSHFDFLASGGLLESPADLKSLLRRRKLPAGQKGENPYWFKPKWVQPLTFLAARLLDVGPLLKSTASEPNDLFHHILGWRIRFITANPVLAGKNPTKIADEWLATWEAHLQTPNDCLLPSINRLLEEASGANPEFGDRIFRHLREITRHTPGDRKLKRAAVDALISLNHPRTGAAVSKLLCSEDPALQAAAAEGLKRLRDHSIVEPLTQIAHDDTKALWLRETTLAALGCSSDDRALRVLCNFVVSPAQPLPLRIAATEILARHHGRSLFSLILSHLNSEEFASLRTHFIAALGRIGDGNAVPPLQILARNPKSDLAIRIAAARSLRHLKPNSAAPLLTDWLSDPAQSEPLKLAAAEMAEQCDESLIPVLRNLLCQQPPPPLEFAAARSLASLGDQGAVALLEEFLQNRPQFRNAAAATLVQFGSDSILEGLLDQVTSSPDPDLRTAIAGNLGSSGSTDAAEILKTLVQDDANDFTLRRAAADSLIQLGERLDTSAFEVYLIDPDRTREIRRDRNRAFQQQCAEVLGKLGDRSAIRLLQQVLRHFDDPSDFKLRSSAARALWRLSLHRRQRIRKGFFRS